MKKIIKQFRAPFKSNSPNMKKKLHHDTHSNAHKGTTQPQPPKKKNSAQNVTVKGNIINKNLTETGPEDEFWCPIASRADVGKVGLTGEYLC